MAGRFHPTLNILLHSLVVTASLTLAGGAGAETVGERLLKLFGSDRSPAVTEEFLDPEQAFRFFAAVSGNNTVNLMWQIEEGYYLYHDKFSVVVLESSREIVLGKPAIPGGTMKVDESFGNIEINTGEVVIDIPVQVMGDGDVLLTLQVGYQGCKVDSICYPPIKKEVPLVLAGVSAQEEQ